MGLAVFCIFLTAINLGAIVFYIKQNKNAQARQRIEFEALRKEFRVLTTSMTEVGCHLIEVERQLSDMGDKHAEFVDIAQSDGEAHADYDQAKRLLEMGADIDELMSSCGLTRAEAELLERVQSRVV